MYTATFYSFKGGTGRSMALANVAIELAKRGRRVLMVDFDLEAPGLDTFRALRTEGPKLGLVDYVLSYLETDKPPHLDQYLYSVPFDFNSNGSVWLMSAGGQDGAYDDRYKSIDWQELYTKRNGFLLFENLKAEWEKHLKPDYVLIDSRTGHTDIGGICTRQLPDAVVIFFFPNEQNRRGLGSIVDSIRSEKEGPLKKEIELLFVMANVPDLDDEEEIISANLQSIKHTLSFAEPDAIIHHYNSLSLLNQALFCLERPKSRLAQEYRGLAQSIVRNNLEDEEGAIEFLDEALREMRNRAFADTTEIEERLDKIGVYHKGSVEVLRRLAQLRRRQAKSHDALALLDNAVRLGLHDRDVLLARADLNLSANNTKAAQSDLIEILGSDQISSFDLSVTVRLLRKAAPVEFAAILMRSPAVRQAKFNIELARELEGSVETLPLCELLLRKWRPNVLDASDREILHTELVLCLIGQGRFEDAKEECLQGTADPCALEIRDLYNYAMAEWGLTGQIRKEYFERVMELHSQREPSPGANYNQCIAITARAIGKMLEARISLQRTLALAVPGSVFSSWSYLTVSRERFLEEVKEMADLLDTDNFVPLFITRARGAKSQSATKDLFEL